MANERKIVTGKRCEIEDCGCDASYTANGIRLCQRCEREFVSVGYGAARFGGRWHGVRGASYTAEEVSACPGVEPA